MTTHTITGAIPQYSGSTITFRNVDTIISSGATYPPRDTVETIGVLGAFSATVIVPDTGAARYAIVLPGIDPPPIPLVPIAAGGPTTLELLLTAAIASYTPDALLQAIALHAALRASTTVHGHVAADGVTISSTNGVLSAVGGTGDRTYRHIQSAATGLWTVTHNLGKYPSVSVVDTSLRAVWGEVAYLSVNSLTVAFSAAFAGEAYIN